MKRRFKLSRRTFIIIIFCLCAVVVTAEAILLAHTFQKRKSGAGKKAGEAAAEDSPKAYFVWKPVKIETYGVYESSGIGSEPAYYLDYMLAYEYDDHARVLFSVFTEDDKTLCESYWYEPTGVIKVQSDRRIERTSFDNLPEGAKVSYRTKYGLSYWNYFRNPQVTYNQDGCWLEISDEWRNARFSYDENGRLMKERLEFIPEEEVYEDIYEYDEDDDCFDMNRTITRSIEGRIIEIIYESYRVENGKKMKETTRYGEINSAPGACDSETVFEYVTGGTWETRKKYYYGEVVREERLWHHPFEESIDTMIQREYPDCIFQTRVDAKGNPSELIAINGDGAEKVIEEYDKAGRVLRDFVGSDIIEYKYDSNGNLAELIYMDGDTGRVTEKVVVEYELLSIAE